MKGAEGNPNDDQANIMSNPVEALIRLFIMTVGEFATLYQDLHTCQGEGGGGVGELNAGQQTKQTTNKQTHHICSPSDRRCRQGEMGKGCRNNEQYAPPPR